MQYLNKIMPVRHLILIFLARSISNSKVEMENIFREILALETDDAIIFDLNSLEIHNITEFKEYHGLRISVVGYLDRTSIPVGIDIGYGDVVYPDSVEMEFPVILEGDFHASKPNEEWLTDVTEFKWYEGTQKHKIHLSAILDLYDRRIAAFVIRDRNDNPLVFDTFDAAVAANPDAHPLFHSDRDSNTPIGYSIRNRSMPE